MRRDYCDRCGKEITDDKRRRKVADLNQDRDLCEDCHGDFRRFIGGAKVETQEIRDEPTPDPPPTPRDTTSEEAESEDTIADPQSAR